MYKITQLIPKGYQSIIAPKDGIRIECQHNTFNEAVFWIIDTVRKCDNKVLLAEEIEYYELDLALDVVVKTSFPKSDIKDWSNA